MITSWPDLQRRHRVAVNTVNCGRCANEPNNRMLPTGKRFPQQAKEVGKYVGIPSEGLQNAKWTKLLLL